MDKKEIDKNSWKDCRILIRETPSGNNEELDEVKSLRKTSASSTGRTEQNLKRFIALQNPNKDDQQCTEVGKRPNPRAPGEGD